MKKSPSKRYYLKHRTKILKKYKKYYATNKEQILRRLKKNYSRGYYYTHPEKFNTLKVRYSFSKLRAKNRGLDFNLTFNDYTILLNKPCFYCLESLSHTGVGLDRIDNSKGYQLDNVLPCCGRCNTSRRDNFTVEEWKVMVTAFLEFKRKI
jgi:hypothetical protein